VPGRLIVEIVDRQEAARMSGSAPASKSLPLGQDLVDDLGEGRPGDVGLGAERAGNDAGPSYEGGAASGGQGAGDVPGVCGHQAYVGIAAPNRSATAR
jgi:hypothetical protein